MNNNEIDTILKKNERTRNIYLGCFAADAIPSIDLYPFAAVINTDRVGYPGTHWVAIYAPNKRIIEYFDSFGDPPNPTIGTYLLQFENIHLNRSVIQSVLSDVCGQFCIYFIWQRSTKTPYRKLLNRLLSMQRGSDNYVKGWVKKL